MQHVNLHATSRACDTCVHYVKKPNDIPRCTMFAFKNDTDGKSAYLETDVARFDNMNLCGSHGKYYVSKAAMDDVLKEVHREKPLKDTLAYGSSHIAQTPLKLPDQVIRSRLTTHTDDCF